jgi:hypothetical protein
MARSRIVKPEFWDDEVLALNTSRDARLTFIGMWNYSDDYGVVKGSLVWLKNKIFPYEEIRPETFKKWIGELEKGKWIYPFEADHANYYYISAFIKHQVINRPSQARNPEPTQQIIEDSLSAHKPLSPEVKRSKVNIIKQKFCNGVFLTEEEHENLKKQFGDRGAKDRIENLDLYIGSKGDKYKSHYMTILSWERKNGGLLKPKVEGCVND